MNAEQKAVFMDAINQSFELLRLNYHHLYFSAYNEIDALNSAKRLWLDSLHQFSPHTILQAVHSIIKTSDYLPTISRVTRACAEQQFEQALPTPRNAYIEACNASSPKANASWSHPAVYYAGKRSDWYFLANNEERVALPVFTTHYDKLIQQVLDGHILPPIARLALPNKNEEPLAKEENIERMKAMRQALDI